MEIDPRIEAWGLCSPKAEAANGGNDATAAMRLTSRRNVIAGIGAGMLSWLSISPALAQVALGSRRHGRALVVVFLRGGADGLSLVPPHGDDDYYRARPNLALGKNDLVRLDDRFGLHPALRPLEPLYREGVLAALHAVGSQDATRSHFEAMDTMERGVGDRVGPSTGWVARYLDAAPADPPSPLRAVAFGHTTPTSLVGATSAVTLASLDEFRLEAPADARAALASLYADGTDEVRHAGRETLQVLKTLERLDPARQRPRNGAAYPETGLGQGMRQVATLLRANVGLEIACLDMGGFDTHVAQGTTIGWLPTLLGELGNTLAAFAKDLGPELKDVTVVVMSEFGRRIAENTGLGTDHGHGGAMLAMGGGIRGGRVHADWPGLAEGVGPGDVAVTTDYRDVLAEILTCRLGLAASDEVFPNHARRQVDLLDAASGTL